MLPTGQNRPVRSKTGKIWEGSPLNLHLIIRLMFNGNQYLFQLEKNLEVEDRFNGEY